MNTFSRIAPALLTLLAMTAFCPSLAADNLPAKAVAGLTGTVVVANQASDTVSLIDLAKMEAYRHVDVVGGPHEVAVSPDGKRVIVTNYRTSGGLAQKTLSLISLPEGETIKVIDLGEYSAPHDVHRMADGSGWATGRRIRFRSSMPKSWRC